MEKEKARSVIFRTNNETDAHIRRVQDHTGIKSKSECVRYAIRHYVTEVLDKDRLGS